jgi:hypothetical protein
MAITSVLTATKPLMSRLEVSMLSLLLMIRSSCLQV